MSIQILIYYCGLDMVFKYGSDVIKCLLVSDIWEYDIAIR